MTDSGAFVDYGAYLEIVFDPVAMRALVPAAQVTNSVKSRDCDGVRSSVEGPVGEKKRMVESHGLLIVPVRGVENQNHLAVIWS